MVIEEFAMIQSRRMNFFINRPNSFVDSILCYFNICYCFKVLHYSFSCSVISFCPCLNIVKRSKYVSLRIFLYMWRHSCPNLDMTSPAPPVNIVTGRHWRRRTPILKGVLFGYPRWISFTMLKLWKIMKSLFLEIIHIGQITYLMSCVCTAVKHRDKINNKIYLFITQLPYTGVAPGES